MDSAEEYAEGDQEYKEWLEKVDSIVLDRCGLSVFDLEDMLFHESYDDDESPDDFVREVVVENVRENHGERYAELLEE